MWENDNNNCFALKEPVWILQIYDVQDNVFLPHERISKAAFSIQYFSSGDNVSEAFPAIGTQKRPHKDPPYMTQTTLNTM